MISQNVVCFPNNVVDILAEGLKAIDPETSPGRNDGLRVVRRPVHPTDSTETVSVCATTWTPDANSQELGQREPTLQRYGITVESMVKDMDE